MPWTVSGVSAFPQRPEELPQGQNRLSGLLAGEIAAALRAQNLGGQCHELFGGDKDGLPPGAPGRFSFAGNLPASLG
ncbi:MAG: hypothetical protein AB1405_01005 [Bdellovibrionota bacterium]